MKKCRHCGTPQSDDRQTCIDCGHLLGEPLSDTEEAILEAETNRRLTAVSDAIDVFAVGRKELILGIIGTIGLIASIVLLCTASTELNHVRDAWKDQMQAAIQSSGDPFGAFEITSGPRSPSREDYLEQAIGGAIVAIAFFLESCTLLLFPRFIWFWSTLRDRLWYADEPTPSEFAEGMMRLSKYGGFVIGCIALAFAAWMYF